jgi:hypothetical protein
MWLPNGLRYPLGGGTRSRHFDGINSKPGKVPENAQTPTSRVHALLGALLERRPSCVKVKTKPILQNCTQNKNFSNDQKISRQTETLAKQNHRLREQATLPMDETLPKKLNEILRIICQ